MLNAWRDKVIDFDQVHSQADCDTDMCLCLREVLRVNNRHHHINKLIENLYGLRQVGNNFDEKLKSELEKRGYIQAEADPCAFYRKGMLFMCHGDNLLITCPIQNIK